MAGVVMTGGNVRALALVLMVAVMVPPLARAQAKADFSGTWTIVPGSGQPNGVGGLGQKFTAVQTAKTITITNTLPIVGQTTTIYNLDGSPSTNTIKVGPMSAERVSTLLWEERTLVINSVVTAPNIATRTMQVWRIENGEFVAEQTSGDGARKEITHARYRKN
jgi:hypothetical protein